MSTYLLPVVFTLFLWWFSTGVILYLNGLPQRTFKWTLLGATGVLVLALYGLAASRHDTTVAGAYCAFTSALMVWAWQEVAFLLGYVTGPRRLPCPPDSRGWPRFVFACKAIAHHELALVVLAVAVFLCTQDGANLTGWWTYLVLWAMRQSAKLNVFLGVRNLNEGFLPPHLKYIDSYFRRQPMNRLFPVAVTLATGVAVLLWRSALASGLTDFEAASLTFVATLLTLAILEHGFMVLPLPSEVLWQWGLRSRRLRPAHPPQPPAPQRSPLGQAGVPAPRATADEQRLAALRAAALTD